MLNIWDIWIQVIIEALPGLGAIALKLIGAILVFIIGWFFALGIGKLVAEILARVKLNQVFERAGWKTALEKAEVKVNPSEFIGAIVKWILVIVVLLAVADVLDLVVFAGAQ